MSNENSYISLCKKQISGQLNLENDSLVQRDFEYLNKVIFEKSGIDLSTATLRRIWSGEYDEKIPQTKTLDALAQVLDYDGWHEFKKANPVQKKSSKNFVIRKLSQLLVVVVVILGGITIWRIWNPFGETTVSLVPEKTSHEGVPATIGFNYDISKIDDQVMIQLSWNPYERTILDPNKNFYTGTYFYPDYHEAKLLLEEEVLGSCNVHITTPGWHGLVMKSGLDINPIYVDSIDFLFKDRLAITDQLFEKYSLHQLESMYSVFTFSNPVLDKINGDAFELNTSFKDLGYLFYSNCHQMDIVIKGAINSIRIPISSEGCYGITALKCSETIYSGKTTDLSSLSTDLQQSQSMNISTKDHQLLVKIGSNQPFQTTYSEPIGPLKVVKFIFMGYGEVTEFKLESGGVLLKDDKLKPF